MTVIVFVVVMYMLYQLLSYILEPKVSSDKWNNQEAYRNDILNGVSHKDRMDNVRKGKYK